MIETTQKFNAIDQNTILNLIDYYYSIGNYDTDTMNKASPGKAVSILQDLFECHLGKKLEYVTGNFYRHTIPYLPHTDYKVTTNINISIVIPLSRPKVLPHLVIFDQIWDLDSITWCMHLPVGRFKINLGVKGCPYEYPVKNLTNKPIDCNLYKQYLIHYPMRTLFGLSGKAYSLEPGSFIVFDPRRIHCTANMAEEKIGLTMLFK